MGRPTSKADASSTMMENTSLYVVIIKHTFPFLMEFEFLNSDIPVRSYGLLCSLKVCDFEKNIFQSYLFTIILNRLSAKKPYRP